MKTESQLKKTNKDKLIEEMLQLQESNIKQGGELALLKSHLEDSGSGSGQDGDTLDAIIQEAVENAKKATELDELVTEQEEVINRLRVENKALKKTSSMKVTVSEPQEKGKQPKRRIFSIKGQNYSLPLNRKWYVGNKWRMTENLTAAHVAILIDQRIRALRKVD